MVKRIPISQKVKGWTAKRESEEVIVRAWQHDHRAGSSPAESRTRGLISKPGGNASGAGKLALPEGRASAARQSLKGLRRSTSP